MVLPFVLTATKGHLSSRIFENAKIGLPPTLFYGISFSLQRFTYKGEEVETDISLDNIELPVVRWRDIGNQAFEFPINPQDGYIDASLYLAGAHNPVDCTRIAFSNWSNSTVNVQLNLEIDFAYEGPSELGRATFTPTVLLDYDEHLLDQVEQEYEPIRLQRKPWWKIW